MPNRWSRKMIHYNDEEVISQLMMSDGLKKAVVCEDNGLLNLIITFFDDKDDVALTHTSGWERVREFVEEVSNTDLFSGKLILGVVDRDYRNFHDLDGIYGSNKFITTKYHDCEMDVALSPAFDKFIRNKAAAKFRDSAREILRSVFPELIEIGLIRMYSHINSKGWAFQAIDIKFSLNDWISTFRQKNSVNHAAWSEFESWKSQLKYEAHDVIRGHDLTAVLHTYLQRDTTKKTFVERCFDISEDLVLSVERSMQIHFPWTEKVKEFFEA